MKNSFRLRFLRNFLLEDLTRVQSDSEMRLEQKSGPNSRTESRADVRSVFFPGWQRLISFLARGSCVFCLGRLLFCVFFKRLQSIFVLKRGTSRFINSLNVILKELVWLEDGCFDGDGCPLKAYLCALLQIYKNPLQLPGPTHRLRKW